VAVAVPVVRARAARQRRQAAVVGGLPDVIDLLRIGVDAGLDVGGALRAVVDSGSGPDDTDEDELVSVLARVRQRADRGDLLVDALTELRALGEPARALYEGLVAAQRDGVPLLPALERAGTDARDRRRRQREEAARQLPVKLLFPLVFCTLPALVLLTVVPLLARSLPSLTPEVVGPFERQPVAPVTTPGPRGVHPCCR
jgi:tight adherence protein C